MSDGRRTERLIFRGFGFFGLALGVWNGATFWPDAPWSAAAGITFGSTLLGLLVGKALLS